MKGNIKRWKILVGILFILLLAVSAAGCDKIVKKDKDTTEFVRGPEGLVMSFVPNYPADKFIVSNTNEPISILVEVRNKGTYPPQGNDIERAYFTEGAIHLSGFDTSIIQMEKLSQEIGKVGGEFILHLPAASSVNPLGGLDTAEFDGNIVANNILIESYNPTILVTACYAYMTKATPSVCIDPYPFDTRQEKVCTIGSQTVPNQGAPVAVTKIDQEAAGNKIQFKIHIKNAGNGDVIWDKGGLSNRIPLLKRCNPNEGGRLDRKDFDKVQLEKVMIGSIDLMRVIDDPITTKSHSNCAPFADGTDNIVRLFNGEGFVICTLNVPDLGTIESAYTTPIDIELRYGYRSTISKQIQIKKLETIGG